MHAFSRDSIHSIKKKILGQQPKNPFPLKGLISILILLIDSDSALEIMLDYSHYAQASSGDPRAMM